MIERIIVARTNPFAVPADWVWLVRDAEGVVIGFGVEFGEAGGVHAREIAVACFELHFDEPLPEGFVSTEGRR